MSPFQAVIFGIVEGISEFLPISSTGHLILTSRLLGLAQTEFLKSFEIAIQFGAILSVVVLYWKSLFTDREVLKRVLAAFIPTGILGFLLYKLVKKFLLGNGQVVLWSLFLGGVFLILFELYHVRPDLRSKSGDCPDFLNLKNTSSQGRKDRPTTGIAKLSYKTAVLIGVFQTVSMIPGVSRSAATIVGGLILGMERKTIVEFSFLLAVPTMLAATGLDLVKNADSFSRDQFGLLLIGFFTSFIVAIAVIKWFLHFIKQHNFIPFGIYRIVLVIIFWFVLGAVSA